MSADPGRHPEREDALRRMLADAVEPIEPAPGAQTRLLARARAQQRRRQRPLMTRLGVPVATLSFLALVVLAVVFVRHAEHGSNGSSASSTVAGGAPSRAAESSTAAAAESGPAGRASALTPVPPRKQLSSKAADSDQSATGDTTFNDNPQVPVPAALVPSDLDGDGRPDTFTLGAGTLAADLSRYGLEAVSLPRLRPGAKVLGVTSLLDSSGQPVAVVLVRLQASDQSSTDTLATLVNGHLTVLRQGSGPVLLAIDATHGYVCEQGILAISGSATPFVVDGAQLVASSAVRAAAPARAAASGKTTGCITP